MRLPSTTTGASNEDSDILRHELQPEHAELDAATAATDAHWRQQGWHALNYPLFFNAALHCEQESHDRAEVAVAEDTAQTRADMLHKVYKIEQDLDNTDSNHHMEMDFLEGIELEDVLCVL